MTHILTKTEHTVSKVRRTQLSLIKHFWHNTTENTKKSKIEDKPNPFSLSLTQAFLIDTTVKFFFSTYPTAAIPAPKRSGLWFKQAPTKRPPLEPPWMTSLSLQVYFSLIRYSAAAIKSSNPFCLFRRRPWLCHFSPYSPPPRILAMT